MRYVPVGMKRNYTFWDKVRMHPVWTATLVVCALMTIAYCIGMWGPENWRSTMFFAAWTQPIPVVGDAGLFAPLHVVWAVWSWHQAMMTRRLKGDWLVTRNGKWAIDRKHITRIGEDLVIGLDAVPATKPSEADAPEYAVIKAALVEDLGTTLFADVEILPVDQRKLGPVFHEFLKAKHIPPNTPVYRGFSTAMLREDPTTGLAPAIAVLNRDQTLSTFQLMHDKMSEVLTEQFDTITDITRSVRSADRNQPRMPAPPILVQQARGEDDE